MDDFENKKQLIKKFLDFCLSDGFYEFIVGGESFALETVEDLEVILDAICALQPALFEFRVMEAERALASHAA